MSNYLFINNALSGTGGARVILNLSEALIAKGHNVSILVDRIDNIDFEIPEDINLYYSKLLKIKRASNHAIKIKQKVSYKSAPTSRFKVHIKNKIKKIYRIADEWLDFLLSPIYCVNFKKFIKKNEFDYIINSNIYFYTHRIKALKKLDNYYVSYHNAPSDVFNRKDFYRIFSWREVFSDCKNIAVSHGIANELEELDLDDSNNVRVIYNPFDFDIIRNKAVCNIKTAFDSNYFVIVGTLTERKRVDRAIKALKGLLEYRQDISLVVVGCGDLESELVKLAKELGIVESVHFVGFMSNPYPLIYNSNGLILTSDSEGLPTVLIESLIIGTPVISTDCKTGPKEILSPNFLANLIPLDDNDEIIEFISMSMMRVLDENLSREHIINNAKLSRFNGNNIVQSWANLK